MPSQSRVLTGGGTGAGGSAADPRLPDPICQGQVLFSDDGLTWEARQPLTTHLGWMVNDKGKLIVKG